MLKRKRKEPVNKGKKEKNTHKKIKLNDDDQCIKENLITIPMDCLYSWLDFDTKKKFRLISTLGCKKIDTSMTQEADLIGRKHQKYCYDKLKKQMGDRYDVKYQNKPLTKNHLQLIGFGALGYGHLIFFKNQQHIWKTTDNAAIHGRSILLDQFIASIDDPKLKIRIINRAIYNALNTYQYHVIELLMKNYGDYKGLSLKNFLNYCIEEYTNGMTIKNADAWLVQRPYSIMMGMSKRNEIFNIFFDKCGPKTKEYFPPTICNSTLWAINNAFPGTAQRLFNNAPKNYKT